MKKIILIFIFLTQILFITQLFSYNNFIWTGATDTDWSNSDNWESSSTSPNTDQDNVIIPTGLSNYPIISTPETHVRSVTIENGASLDLGGKWLFIVSADTINIGSKFICEGTLIHNEGIIILNPRSGNGAIELNYNDFFDLEFELLLGVTDGFIFYTNSNDLNIEQDFLNYNDNNLVFNVNSKNITIGNILSGSGFENCNSITMTGGGNILLPSGYGTFLNTELIISSSDIITVNNGEVLKCKELSILSGTLELGLNGGSDVNCEIGKENDLTYSGDINISSNALFNVNKGDLTIFGGNINNLGIMNIDDPEGGMISLSRGSISGNGQINAGSGIFKIGKDFIFDGIFNKQNSTVRFSGSLNSSIKDGTEFFNLSIEKDLTSNVVETIGVISFSNLLNYSEGYFKGGLRTTRTDQFFSTDNYLDYSLETTGDITITKYTGIVPPCGGNALKNYVIVNSSSNVTSFSSYYRSGGEYDELVSGFVNQEGNLKVWNTTDNGNSWTKFGGFDDESKYSYNGTIVVQGEETVIGALDNSCENMDNYGYPPLLGLAESDTSGSKIILTFNKDMLDPSGEEGSFLVKVNNNQVDITELSLGENNYQIEISLENNTIGEDSIVILSYTQGNISSVDGGLLDTFENYDVVNMTGVVGIYQGNLFLDDNKNYKLGQNYPNPFNPDTRINYELRITNYESAEIVVHNSVGQEVWSKNLSTIHSSLFTNHCTFDGSKFNSGIFFYSLFINGLAVSTKKMVLQK